MAHNLRRQKLRYSAACDESKATHTQVWLSECQATKTTHIQFRKKKKKTFNRIIPQRVKGMLGKGNGQS